MASVPVASQVEVLDLRHFSARQLRLLLEREAEIWRERLRWDYRSATGLLLQYLEARILNGFAALDQGRLCGYTFFVFEGNKAVVGDAFATGHRTMSDAETARVLLTHALEMLRHAPGVERVESQLLMYEAGEFADLFAGPEFTVYPRLFLECDIRRRRSDVEAPELPAGLELTTWTPADYQTAGEVIFASYGGHPDAEINDQYKSVHGSLRFLHNIVRFPGCGTFEPNYSWLLREKKGGAMVGMVLCSRVAPEVAHITQLCVAKEYRGTGLGAALLEQAIERLRRGGFEAISLTVTEANASAVRLYERFGFTLRHRFDAMVLDTRYKA